MADEEVVDRVDWGSRRPSPAEPSGLTQASSRWAQAAQARGWAPASAREGAGDWYGGRNFGGPENAWGADFYTRTIRQRNEQLDKAGKSGNPGEFYDWFQRPDATGVATWDDPKRLIMAGNVRRGVRHGDVFDNGRWTGNLYDDNKEEDADLLISRFMFDGDQQRRLNTAEDIPLAYRRAVQSEVDKHTDGAAHGEQAWATEQEIAENVREQNEDWLGGSFDWMAATGASAAGGAALGSIVPGVGTLVGAGVGAVVGGIAGWLNRDQFTETLARVRVQAERAGERDGFWAAAAADLQGLGRIGQMAISPIQNTIAGSFDVFSGDPGDGVADFYKIDTMTGERRASGKWQAAHLIGSIGDSFLQFGSPTAALAYRGSLATMATGKAAGIGLTDSVWVDEYGDFHNMEGAGEHASAILDTGIDFLQLGMTGAFARSAAAVRGKAVGEELPAAQGAERLGDWAAKRFLGVGQTEGARAPEILSGRKFFFDTDGNVTGSRLMLGAFVPSEMTRWIPANYMARYSALRNGGAMTQDDVYEAALRMSGTGGRMGDAVLNAFGEGSEEMVQAVLEPMSHGGRPIGEQVYLAGAYGFAGGLGMSLAPMMGRAGSEAARRDYAFALETLRSGEELDRGEWNERWAGMSRAEKNRASSANAQEARDMKRWYDAVGARRAYEAAGTGFLGALAMQRTVVKRAEDAVAARNPAVDAAMQMHILPHTMFSTATELGTGRTIPGGDRATDQEAPRYAINAGIFTSFRLLEMYRGKQRMLRIALQAEDTTDEEKVRWASEGGVLDMVVAWLESQHGRIQNEANPAQFDRRIAHVNAILLNAVRTGDWIDKDGNHLGPDAATAVRDAVELNIVRHPIIDSGSIFTVVPQIDAGYILGNMHGTIGLSQPMQKPAQGDYDGDAPVSLNQADFREGKRATMRSGPQYAVQEVQTDTETGEPVGQRWVLNSSAPDNEGNVLSRISDTMRYNGSLAPQAAQTAIAVMRNHITARYGRLLEPSFNQSRPLLGYLNEFEQMIWAGDPKARTKFVESILNHESGQGYEALMEMGRRTHRPEILELLQMITTGLDNISRDLNSIAFDARDAAETAQRDRDRIDDVSLKYLEQVAQTQAATLSQTAQLVYGPDGTRTAGHMHYNPFIRSAVDLTMADPSLQLTALEEELARTFMESGSGEARTDLERVEEKDITGRRVRAWSREVAEALHEMSQQGQGPGVLGPASIDPTQGMLVWGQISAPSIEVVDGAPTTTPRVPREGADKTSLLQLLLAKSVAIDEERNRSAAPDNAIHAKLARLKGYTRTKGLHPITPSLAAFEVYGNMQAFDLVGEPGAHFLGANLTMNQHAQILAVMSDDSRKAQLEWFMANPLYIKDRERGDPPYSIEDINNGRINSFTVYVDILRTVSNTRFSLLEGRGAKTGEKVKEGFSALNIHLQSLIDKSAAEIRTALGRGKTDPVDEEHALEFALRYEELAKEIGENLPEEAFDATFKIEGSRVYTAKWVREMLLASPERAELMLFMEPLFDQFNVLGGTVDRRAILEDKEAEPTSGVVDPDRIDSRMLQLIHNLASMPSNAEIAEFIKLYENSTSVEGFLEKVNTNTLWVGNQPKYLPYADSKKDFEVDPRDIWAGGGTNAERLERLNDFGARVELLTQQQRTAVQVNAANENLISRLQALEEAERNSTEPPQEAQQYEEVFEGLKKVQARARWVATTNGGKVREQFQDTAVEQPLHLENKGAADPRLRAMGEWLVVSTGEALEPGVMLEAEKLTMYSIDSIRMNPDLLMRGNTRIRFKDGSETEIDLTKMDQLLAGLASPGLSAVVWAAVFPTYRDINPQGVLQLYQAFGPDVSLLNAIEQSQLSYAIPRELGSMTVEQADAIISMFEGYAKRASEYTKDADQRKLGFFPVMKIINEVSLAYTTRADYGRLSTAQREALNRKARIKVARALVTVMQVGSSNREFLKDALNAALVDRAQGGANEYLDEVLEEAYSDVQERKRQKLSLILILSDQTARDLDKYTRLIEEHEESDRQLKEARRTGSTRDEDFWTKVKSSLPARAWVQAQYEHTIYRQSELARGVVPNSDPGMQEYASVYRAFEVHPDDKSVDAEFRRGMLIDFLLDGSNFPAIQGDKKSQDLIDKLLHEHTHNPELRQGVSKKFPTFAEWQQLATIAAKRQIAVSATRSSSGVMFATHPTPDGVDVMEDARLWDRTFSYMAKPLLDNPILLEAMDWFQTQVGMPRIDSLEAVDRLMKDLFSEEDLGEWNPLLPGATLLVQKALDGASVGLTIPIGGSTPVSMFDTAVSQYATWAARIDRNQHVTQIIARGNAARPPREWFDDAHAILKLHNHFVEAIDTTALEQSLRDRGLGDPDIKDIVRKINNSLHEHPDPDVDTQGFRFFDLLQLQETMIRIEEAFDLGDFELGISFVDVGKKPFTAEFANHGLFDGVGRLTKGSGAISPFAAMIFGVSGISKILQQQPLDFAAKNGAAYTMYITSDLEDVIAMEKTAGSVEELMMLKAEHMHKIEYESGWLLTDDLPALYKLMKSRHVYRGKDLSGTERLMWAEEVIALERSTDPAVWSSKDLEMIPLSEEIHRLLVGASAKQAGHAITRPEYDIDEVSKFHLLTEERLRSLGLENLGKKVEPAHSDLAMFTRLSGMNSLDPRTAGTFQTSYAQRVEEGMRDRREKIQYRSQHNGKGENDFDMPRISKTNTKRSLDALDGKSLPGVFARLGIPQAWLGNAPAEQAAMKIAQGLDPDKLSNGSVHWFFDYNSMEGWNKGVLNYTDINNGLSSDAMQKGGPTWGDLVTLDLTSILRAFGGDEKKAARFTQEALKVLEKKGVTIILVGRGNAGFHGMVSKWVQEGNIDYVRVGGSPYVFEPTTDDNARGKTIDALERSLTTVHAFPPGGATLVMDIERGALVSEAAAIVVDESQFQALQRRQITLVPTAVTLSQTGRSEEGLVFNVPRTPRQTKLAINTFSALLKDKEELDKLTSRAAYGNETGPPDSRTPDPDPKDTAQYQKYDNGRYDPGIRSWKDAVKKFQETIDNGKLPLYEGQTGLMAGDIVVMMDMHDRFFLYRLGMKIPDGTKMRAVYDGSRINTSLPKIEDAQTLPPNFRILELDPDMRGTAAEVEWDLDLEGKVGLTSAGVKLTVSRLPADYEMPPEKMGVANGKGIAYITSTDAMKHKLGIQKRLNNFSTAFAIFGIDFRKYLVNGLMGKQYTSVQQDGFEEDWNTLRPFLKAWEQEWHGLDSSQIAELMRSNLLFTEKYIDFSKQADRIMPGLARTFAIPPLDFSQANSGDVNIDISRIFLAALSAPETTLEHIISTPGLLTATNLDAGIMEMPRLLTDALDNRAMLPHVRRELFADMNAVLPKFNQGAHEGTPMYHIDDNFNITVSIRNKNTGLYEDFTGGLTIVFPVHNTENPAAYAQSALMKSRNGFTPHIANVLGLTTDARMLVRPRKGPSALDETFGENKIIEFGADPGRDLAAMLNRVPDRTKSFIAWEGEPPLVLEGRRQSLESIGDYNYRINKDLKDWKDPKTAGNFRTAYDEFLKVIGMGDPTRSVELLVDKHVRMYLGAPGPIKDQEGWEEHVTPEMYIETLNHFTKWAGQHRNFMEGGAIPIPAPDLINLIFQNRKWAPLKSEGKGREELADTWDDWVRSLFGQMFNSRFTFDVLFAEEFDGVLQQWKDYTKVVGALGLSLDMRRELMTKHTGTNRELLSLNPLIDSAEQVPLILDAWSMGHNSLTGKDRYAASLAGRREAQISGLAQRRSDWHYWLAKNKAPKPMKGAKTVKNYAADGEYYINNAARGSVFFRNLTNMSLAIRMFDPNIYASGYIEQPIRNMMEHVTDILTGSYTGMGARKFMQLAESSKGQKAKAIGQKVSSAIQLGTFEQMYTAQDQAIFKSTARMLGQDTRFLNVLYDDMAYKNLIRHGEGRLGRLIEKAATRTSRAMSDPRFGTSQRAVAERYLAAVVENIVMMGGSVNMASLAKELATDPMWLRKQYGDMPGLNPHMAGMQRVAQVRSQKQTPLGKAIMHRIDTMTSSDSVGVNFIGFLAKLPFMFTRFTANALSFATGMEGWNQAATMFFSGRERPKWLGGREGHETWDLNDCIETMNLQRTMIRSGATLTMVFTLGLMAGGKLGLGGEDEEERRRRKMAKYLNLPQVLDPNEPENSFTYADALFLDSIPILNTLFRDESGHSTVVPHWVLRQMTSPIIGMSRFFQTGDFREIGYGFLDAFSAMPNSVVRLWHEADLTVKMLLDQAEKNGTDDSVEGMARTQSFLIQAFSIYEQALLENSFINNLYAGSDKYDRNPWAVPMTDETGNLVLQPGTGLPQPTEVLTSYIDENGEVQQGYQTRKGLEGTIYQYAENHAMFAALGALFTGNGFSSPLLRSNMAVRERRVTMPLSSDERVMAAILALYEKGGGLETYTKEEIAYKLKADAQANDEWWEDGDIQARAQAIYSANHDEMGALSFITPEAAEILSDPGADRIIDGILKGSLKLGSPAMAGIAMDQDQRDRVGSVIMKRLVQDGVDRGLTETSAKYRAERFYWGDDDYPDIPGIREILYSDGIPSSNVVKYNQLNVMYMMGPDGKPWATPFERRTIGQAFLPFSHRVAETIKDQTTLDSQGKIIDEILGINTGLHGIERIQGPAIEPNDELIEEVLDSGTETTLVPRGARRYGGGGGGGGYFTRMEAFPRGTSPDLANIPFINSNNPYIRRAFVNRQRITSERERLKQWQ